RRAVKVRQPKRGEVHPFTRGEIDAVAAELGPYGPLVVFASETGLRPGEWAALERRDVDRDARIVRVRRAWTFPRQGVPGAVKTVKTTMRDVPLNRRALDALDAIPPRLDTPLVFPAPRGGCFELHNWRARDWLPALDA